MDVIIGKDIREYKVKDIGPLTMREAGWLVVAAACCYITYAIEKAVMGEIAFDSIAILPMMLAAVPGVVIGFVKIHGLPIEKYMQTSFCENFVDPKIRLYESDVVYTDDDLKEILLPEDYEALYDNTNNTKTPARPSKKDPVIGYK